MRRRSRQRPNRPSGLASLDHGVLMATKSANIDLNSVFGAAASQFKGLNPNEPGQWPLLPRVAVWAVVAAIIVALAWFAVLSGSNDELESERAREPALKADYRSKLTQAVNLEELRKQKLQVEEYVTQLEKQLPGKAEMDALLSDINQAGIGRGLQFELFRPGQVLVKDYYAELPIAVKVSGRYHDIGAFAADVSNLSRIVTLHNLTITTPKDAKDSTGALVMETTARTYRYLDSDEVMQQRADDKKAGDKKSGKAKQGAKK
jgi:type IV pilus assembly protein PilO